MTTLNLRELNGTAAGARVFAWATLSSCLRGAGLSALMAISCLLATLVPAQSASRIKDLVDIEGIRTNQLVGYGMVVGLNGSGDSMNNSPFTKKSLESMLDRIGVNISGANARTRNVAAVMVTADLPPFATAGTRIDVTVSSIGDANDLTGGTLLVTPVLGANGKVYAVAQGPLTVSGIAAGGEAESVTLNVPTVGRIANGALIEREVPFSFNDQKTVRLGLRNPDFTTANRITQTVNSFMGYDLATTLDPATIRLSPNADNDVPFVQLITEIEQLSVEPDQPARVVLDERTGIVVMGQHVRISEVAVAQGNLTISVREQPEVVQPLPFSQGVTAVEPNTEVEVTITDNKLAVLPPYVTLSHLVEGLNALGIRPRDMIAILQAIKAAGALQADIVLM